MNQPSLLLPHQRAFLNLFFTGEVAQQFFLTGGTALAEFYLRHRHSEDIDLFTLDESAFNTVPAQIVTLSRAKGLHCRVEEIPWPAAGRQASLRLE
jgi:predicted nucleotidyltransferase component of viral defense system